MLGQLTWDGDVNYTAFPVTPGDVAALTVQEFTFDLDELDQNQAPSMERVCRTFMNDANRALVWWIRFEALQAWYASSEVMLRTSDVSTVRDAYEAAASFPLNHRWEFDAEGFGSAIGAVAVKRARAAVTAAATVEFGRPSTGDGQITLSNRRNHRPWRHGGSLSRR